LFLAALLVISVAGLDQCFSMKLDTGPVPEYFFVEGKKLLDAGNLEAASDAWSNVFSDGLYGPVSFILLARSYRKSGNIQKSEELLKELLRKHPTSVYGAVAKDELVQVLCEQKKAEVAPLLTNMIARAQDKDKPMLLLRLAKLEKNTGNYAKSAEHFKDLFLNYPASVEGIKAGEELAWLVFHGKIQKPSYSESEQSARVNRLYAKGRFDLAAEAYQTLLKEKPGDKGLTLKLARCRFKDRWNLTAVQLLKDLVKGDLSDHDRMEALHLLSLAYWRLDRDKDFELCTTEILAKGSAGFKKKVLFNLGAHYYEKRKFTEARTNFERLLKLGPDQSVKVDVKWKLAWIKYSSGQYKEAAEAFREVRSVSSGGKIENASRYWQARSLMNVNRAAEGQPILKEIVKESPLSYYGIEAARLLKAGGAPADGETPPLRKFPDVGLSREQNSNKLVADSSKLMEKGLHEFALLNLEALPKAVRSSPATAFLMAKAAFGAERYRMAQELLTPVFGSFMENPPADAPPEFVEMAFPRVHFAETTLHAKKHSVDPHLIWAVIRQESRYDPSVVSPAGALGLMQVTPEAAGVAARSGRIPAAAIADILDPRKNIGVGVRVLAKNLHSFGGKVVPAVASYNADIRKVRDWVRRNGKLKPDEFIENIPYLETRLYVKKVLAGYHAYSVLHKKKNLAGFW